jgi:hypothetical protein
MQNNMPFEYIIQENYEGTLEKYKSQIIEVMIKVEQFGYGEGEQDLLFRLIDGLKYYDDLENSQMGVEFIEINFVDKLKVQLNLMKKYLKGITK